MKVPLAGITSTQILALKADDVLVANITGRRPHATEVIVWQRGARSHSTDANPED